MAEADLVDWLRPRGVVRAAEVRRGLGVSAATLSRLAAAAGPAVARLGRGRATRYALLRPVGGLPPVLPVHRIGADGTARGAGELLTVSSGATVLRRAEGSSADFAGLPPVLHDMAPAGYLGRRFAERHPDLGLPASLRDWSDDHRLVALARRGEDAVGDVVLGEESLDRWLSTGHQEVTADDYPRLADEAAAGGAGSSAAGESPKLTAFVAGRHRLIKFTIGDGSPTDERWRDLLVCERLAAEVLRDAGHPSVEASVVDVGSRRFLDVVRFDRHGARGRIGTLSLGAIDDELVGSRESWTRTADALCALRLLSREDRDRLALLEAFSMLIGNDDRHAGNVTFFADGLEARPTLRLAPAYDVLPMALAPNPGGVPELRLSRPTPRARWIDAWPAAVDLARDFWARVAGDERVGAAFRETAAGWVGE